MKTSNGIRMAAWACACLTLACSARSAEQKPPVEQPAPPEATFADEPPYIHDDGGRRDPFTYMKVAIQTPTTPGDPTKPDIAPDQIQVVKTVAEKSYSAAEQALMAGNAREAVTQCDKGLEAFRDIKNVESVPDLQDLRERLFRLRKASERLRNRADAEQAFKNMNLRVSGVVARERDSAAIVNGKAVRKGDLILASDNSEGAIVDDIVPGRVVVRFRGYKMVLDVSQ